MNYECETYGGIEKQVTTIFNRNFKQFREKYRFIKSERKRGRIIENPIYSDIFWNCAEGSEIEKYFLSLSGFRTSKCFNNIVNSIIKDLIEKER